MRGDYGFPFLLRFRQRLVGDSARPIRYDNARQESFVLENGAWVPAVDAIDARGPQTTVTEVKKETTDE